MQSSLTFCSLIASAMAAAIALSVPSAAPALPEGFSMQKIFTSGAFQNPDSNPMNGTNKLSFITTIETMPDGRVFIGTADLRFFFWDPEVDRNPNGTGILPDHFLDLNARKYGEAGVIGAVAAPDYLDTGHFYVSYTLEIPPYNDNNVPEDRRIRIERMTADLQDMNAISSTPGETIIFDITDDNLVSQIHFGGGLMFGSDGMLFFSTGDDAVTANSQSLDSFRGKVLRMNPDGSAPEDNPFYEEGNEGPRNYIYALGLRNPYRLFRDPIRGTKYVTDTGQSTWEELNVLVAGANYGWPILEGPSWAPINDGKTPPPNYHEPFYYYPHFPHGEGDIDGHAIVSGLVYDGDNFPEDYYGDVIITDWGYALIREGSAGEIFRLNLDNEGNLEEASRFYTYPNEQFGAADITLLPDGSLLMSNAGYVLTELLQFWYTPPPAPPVVSITAEPTMGEAPLTVEFTSTVESELDTDILWTFGDGTASTNPNPTKEFERGIYEVLFSATDTLSQTTATSVTIAAHNSFSDLSVQGQVFDVSSGEAVPVEAALTFNDYGYGPVIGAKSSSSGTDESGNFDVELGAFDLYGPFIELVVESPGLVTRSIAISPEEGDWEGDIYLAQSTVEGIVRRNDTSQLVPDMDTWLTIVDGGSVIPYDVFGGRDTDPPSGNSNGALTDSLGRFYFPITESDVGETLTLFANLEQRLPDMNAPPKNVTAVSGKNHVEILMVESSGGDCDLEIAPEPPHTTAFSAVQNVFIANCIGCHGPVSPYMDLNLDAGFGYSSIVERYSKQITNRRLVPMEEPGTHEALEESFLFEKMNCLSPSFGVLMPLTGRISQQERELVADWILAGAPHEKTEVTAWVSEQNIQSLSSVRFRAGAEGPNAPFHWEWEFGDGTTTTAQDPQKVYVALDEVAEYTAVLYAYNSEDEFLGTSELTITVTPREPEPGNEPPVAVLQGQEGLTSGTLVTLDASASHDPDGTIVQYLWDVTDNGTTDFQTVVPFLEYAFPDDGIYRVVLTVVDDQNAWDATHAYFYVGRLAAPDTWLVY